MAKKRATLADRVGIRRVNAVLDAIRPAFQMPVDRERRLKDLIAQSKVHRLPRAESGELRSLLAQVDALSVEMLEHAEALLEREAALKARAAPPARPPAATRQPRRGRTAATAPPATRAKPHNPLLKQTSHRTVDLFNPRVHRWDTHFRWSRDGLAIQGRTPVGRATMRLLRMNRRGMAVLRAGFIRLGLHPPP